MSLATLGCHARLPSTVPASSRRLLHILAGASGARSSCRGRSVGGVSERISHAEALQVQVRTKFTWPSLKRPSIKRYPPAWSVETVNGIVKSEDLLKEEWVQKLFPDGKYPAEWNELEVKDVDSTWVKKPPTSHRPPPVYGDAFEGYTEKKKYVLSRFREVFNKEVVVVVDSAVMASGDIALFRMNLMEKCNFKMFKTNNTLAKRALQKTKFERFGYLISGGAMLWHTDSIDNIKPLLKFLKKEPAGRHMIIGAKIQNRLFNHEQLAQIVEVPSLDAVRGQLASIIGEPAQRVSRNIAHHPATLGRLLASHASPPDDPATADGENSG